MEEEQKRIRWLQEKIHGTEKRALPKASIFSKRYLVVKTLANNTDYVEEFSTNSKDIGTMLESLNSKARQWGCKEVRDHKTEKTKENLFPSLKKGQEREMDDEQMDK